ncbi:MAG: ATP-dependent zinc metalloprotease FtsH [Deltaproteobacteria bacterium]|nr:ATP-dependent zinc metalloprotease FtsH [Deltaproteobacteria bacterium]
MGRRLRWLVLLGVCAVAALLGLQATGTRSPTGVPYHEFKRRLRANEVDEVVLSRELLRGRWRHPGQRVAPRAPMEFETVRVEDPGLLPLLETQGVRYAGAPPGLGPWVVALYLAGVLALFFGWRALARRFQGGAGGLLAFGRNKGKLVGESDVSVRFDDVAGVEEAKEELKEVVQFLRAPEKFVRIGAKIPRGVLLVGPPGTGKTLLARAVAGEARVAFFSLSGSEFVEMFVGVGAARVRDLFENAKEHAPCIVFIDELDALGRARGANIAGTNEEREQTLNQLLVELDGFEPNKGVLLLAATNRPEILDPALLRPGRFDRQVLVDRPDRAGREAILKVHGRNVRLAVDVDLGELAARTPGFAGADLANIVNEAALLAARRDQTEVHARDLEEAIERVAAGLERRSRIITPEERRRVAVHEVGHALVGEVLPGGSRVARISVVPRGMSALGYTLKLPTEERYLMTEPELRATLAGLLGGRAAERLVFGEVSTGAGDDLRRATDLARAMVTDYGMSEKLGPVSLGGERTGAFLVGVEGTRLREHGERVADQVDEEIRRLVEDAEGAARAILQARRGLLDRVAEALLEKEALDGEELRAMLKVATVPPGEVVASEPARGGAG